MMKKLFLHIGMHKTGCTALHAAMSANRRRLAHAGITYPDLGGSHSDVLYSLLCKEPTQYEANRARGITTETEARTHNDGLARMLEASLGSIETNITLMSAEDLSLLGKPQVPELKTFLRRFFDDIHIIGYARPPVSFINSMARHSLASGTPVEQLIARPATPTYQWRFQKYLEVFGADKVSLLLYHRDTLHHGCVVADLLSQMAFPSVLYDELDVARPAPQLSATAAKLVDLINQQVPVHQDGSPNPARKSGVAATLARLPGPPYALPSLVLDRVLTPCEWDINWMKKHLGKSEHADIFDDRGVSLGLMEAPADGFSHSELADIAELIHHLIPDEKA